MTLNDPEFQERLSSRGGQGGGWVGPLIACRGDGWVIACSMARMATAPQACMATAPGLYGHGPTPVWPWPPVCMATTPGLNGHGPQAWPRILREEYYGIGQGLVCWIGGRLSE